ncbi:MAG: Ig-like domain-containing protein [Flavobacteriaceae bacterium]|nr:Ig-like domain-containing protein [Flavobacteriaceae bacterium]NNK60940.1 Ig-like domain-containing protein [Flavobacteriaceae bacterium]
MLKRISNFLAFVTIGMLIINCANRGSPQGGVKDTEPPVITKSIPENYSTNFNSKEIKIYFDEYIKIKNLQRNLIISPPMDPQPEITPLGTASKYITIKINDTLATNTTYAFNFGESIIDNNEDNPYPFYRYVFSTGNYIDSLQVSGSISDALDRTVEEFVSVMLYDVDSTFTDSIVYKEKPKYITSTLDSTSNFTLDNLKAGKYLLVAIKDQNSDYKFQQKTDKIGFVNEYISLPTDTSYTIELFKENVDFKATRPRLLAGQKIAFGYEGDHEAMKIKLLSNRPQDYMERITKDQKRDTLFYWFKPEIASDSLSFEVSHVNYSDTLNVKIKDQTKDSLVVTALQSRFIPFDGPFELEGSVPFESVNEQLISIMDKDSILIKFNTSLDTLNNRLGIDFNKIENNNYKVRLLPGAVTDFFEDTNDTLNFNLKTRSFSDYGNLRLTLKNAKYPVIIQLIDEKNDLVAEKYATQEAVLDFNNILPNRYYLRVIFDDNGNRKYDPGIYLKKTQSERVSYYPEVLEVRASWNLIEEFTLKD